MRRKSPIVSLERLREVYNYDPATGVFTWAKSIKGSVVGERAGFIRHGYRRLWVDNQSYQASSLAWYYVHGVWPSGNVWFNDKDRDNAAIANLRMGKFSDTQKGRAAYHREYRKNNPEKEHAKRIKFNYGISLEQYRAMLLEQNGVCKICEKPETMAQNGRIVPLCVDHDHEDNSIRGLLCQHCNKALGHFMDRQDLLARAISYLQAHASKPKTNVIPLSGRRIANSKGQ